MLLMANDISALAKPLSGNSDRKSIGKSADGRDIYDVIVSPIRTHQEDFVQVAIHAREYIVVPLMMQQLEYLPMVYE